MQLFYAVITLGLLGIDPLGAAVASSAVAAGIKKHKVLLFGLSYFFATAVIGVTLSFLGKEVEEYFHSLNFDRFEVGPSIVKHCDSYRRVLVVIYTIY